MTVPDVEPILRSETSSRQPPRPGAPAPKLCADCPMQAAGRHPALERHYSVAEIAKMWNLSQDKVRDMFRDEPGVLRSQLRAPLRARKRQNITLRIPESVMLRVYDRFIVDGACK
jgi:hypothetical protein